MRKHFIDVGRIKKLLNDYLEDENEIEKQNERLERINTKLYTVGSPELSTMPKSPTPCEDNVTDLIAKKEVLASKIKELVRKHEEDRRYIEVMIWKLKSSDERAIIQMRYLDKENWQDINFIFFGGKNDYLEKESSYLRRIYYIHGDALCNLQRIMDGQNDEQVAE